MFAAGDLDVLDKAAMRGRKRVNLELITDERIAKTSSALEQLKEVYRSRVMDEINKLEGENMMLEEQSHKDENTRKKIRELTVREVEGSHLEPAERRTHGDEG